MRTTLACYTLDVDTDGGPNKFQWVLHRLEGLGPGRCRIYATGRFTLGEKQEDGLTINTGKISVELDGWVRNAVRHIAEHWGKIPA